MFFNHLLNYITQPNYLQFVYNEKSYRSFMADLPTPSIDTIEKNETGEFALVDVEAEESNFSAFLEFIRGRHYASEIIEFLRDQYELTEEELPLNTSNPQSLLQYYSIEFDEAADDGQILFNIYSPGSNSDTFKLSELEKVFSELTLFGESNSKFSTRFLIVSFDDLNGIRPISLDVARLSTDETRSGTRVLWISHQDSIRRKMEAIANKGASKLLVIKLQKPKQA